MNFFTINSDFDRPERKSHRGSRERNGQGTKWPGSELARGRIGQSPIGRFAPGSELARERKGLVPLGDTSELYILCIILNTSVISLHNRLYFNVGSLSLYGIAR